MFTLFDLIRVGTTMRCAAALGVLGWNRLGVVGCIGGIAAGGLLGQAVGTLPLVVGLRLASRRYANQTEAQLLASLHHPDCLIPNLYLLELGQRGYDIKRQLPFVYLNSPLHRLLRVTMARNLCGFLNFETFTYSEYACSLEISGNRKSHAPLRRSRRRPMVSSGL